MASCQVMGPAATKLDIAERTGAGQPSCSRATTGASAVTVLLTMATVLAWELWIPVAQIVPGVPQRSRTFYATLGNTVFAAIALVVGGGHLSFGWKTFWLPFAGGLVWTAGNYTAFRASESIGLHGRAGRGRP